MTFSSTGNFSCKPHSVALPASTNVLLPNFLADSNIFNKPIILISASLTGKSSAVVTLVCAAR
ncbi:MAG: hypothetical protein ACD_29C00018G0001 [uncultured bacterium]|nr:MAG: hypothetical protein ACD_29C00018G0001 [uncultured bacterium]